MSSLPCFASLCLRHCLLSFCFLIRLYVAHMSNKTAEADTFEEFKTSLLSVGKTADDGNVSIFTEIVGRRDERGRYWIPLVQQKGNWQPRKPTKAAQKFLHQANSVYDLPPTEEAVKWMHAICGYPVKSTWIKAIKKNDFVSWPVLTTKLVSGHLPCNYTIL